MELLFTGGRSAVTIDALDRVVCGSPSATPIVAVGDSNDVRRLSRGGCHHVDSARRALSLLLIRTITSRCRRLGCSVGCRTSRQMGGMARRTGAVAAAQQAVLMANGSGASAKAEAAPRVSGFDPHPISMRRRWSQYPVCVMDQFLSLPVTQTRSAGPGGIDSTRPNSGSRDSPRLDGRSGPGCSGNGDGVGASRLVNCIIGNGCAWVPWGSPEGRGPTWRGSKRTPTPLSPRGDQR